jgi:membrane fusion protein (multidrug efflux system)
VNKPFKKIGIAIFVLIVAGVALRIVTRGRGEVVESISDIQKREGVPVRVEIAALGTLDRTLQFSGTIEGQEQSVITSRLMETVREIPVHVGQRVTSGQIVARLDDSNPQAMYRQAKAMLDNAKMDYERMEALFNQGAVSRQALDQAKLGYDVAQSNFTAASDLIDMPSPVSGEVVRVHVKPGEVVSPGTPVVTVAASKEVRVKFWVSAEERGLIARQQAARIHPAQSDTALIPGVVDKVEDAADPKTRLFEVTVRSDNSEGLLKPGVLTTVDVVVEERPGVLSVSNEALLTRHNGEAEIFVVGADGHAARRTVQLGLQTANRVECVSGLSEGDRVVVFGQNLLSDGAAVKIIEG